jgi:transcriptional regulator with XRE-family HTH domain
MGFITEEEARRRLTSGDNLLNRLPRAGSNPYKDPEAEIVPGLESAAEEFAEPEPTEFDDAKDDDPDVLDAVDEALARARTISSSNDPVRIAVLAARRTLPPKQRGGRYPGQVATPAEFRALIGAAARLGNTRQVAEATGMGMLAVHNYKNGKTSNAAEPNPTMLQQIEEKTLGIRDQVLGILSYTVAGITPESLENKDPKELSIIARNLSSIMSSTKPPADFGDKTTNAQVIVFSPEQEKEEAYTTVEAG